MWLHLQVWHSAPARARGLKAACDVGLHSPRAGEGEPVGSMGLLLQKEMALVSFFFPFKIAAGDPLSSGKLLLERDY